MYIYMRVCVYIYIYMSGGPIHYKSIILHFHVRFLISFASLQIFDVIFEVVTDLVQPNPSLQKTEVRLDKTPALLFSTSTTLVLELLSPAAGWNFVLW